MAASLISVYEAALLWFGRNPHERLDGYGGVYDWIILLTRDREVRDIACDILFEIESGRMQAVNPSWRSGIPSSWMEKLGTMPGNLNPRYTMVTLLSLVDLAKRRGDAPIFLSHLMHDPAPDPATHSGGAGRPSAMHLIDNELLRRAGKGELEDTRNAQARVLVEWLKRTHPIERPPTPKAVANHFSKTALYRDLKKQSPK